MKFHHYYVAVAVLMGTPHAVWSAPGDREGMIRSSVTGKCWQADDSTPNVMDYDQSFVRSVDCDENNPMQRFIYTAGDKHLKSLGMGDCVDNWWQPTTKKEEFPVQRAKGLKCQINNHRLPEMFWEKAHIETTCPDETPYCISQVENHEDGSRKVSRSCGDLSKCQEEDQNSDKCDAFDDRYVLTTDMTCTWCCDTDNCNVLVHPHSGAIIETETVVIEPDEWHTKMWWCNTYEPQQHWERNTTHGLVTKQGMCAKTEDDMIKPVHCEEANEIFDFDQKPALPPTSAPLVITPMPTHLRTPAPKPAPQAKEPAPLQPVPGASVPTTPAAPGPAPGSKSFPAGAPEPAPLQPVPGASVPATPAAPAPAPGSNSSPAGAPGSGSASGDPHFVTFSRVKYDFHGECDLVLLENPGFANDAGLRIHIRTKIHASSWWSFIERAVLQIGEQTLEVSGGRGFPNYWINGQEGEELSHGAELMLSGFPVKFSRINNHQRRYRVELGHGEAIGVEVFKEFVRVSVKPQPSSSTHFANAVGLMGSYKEGGKMLGRDGVTEFGVPEAKDFGFEWQVLPEEPALFHAYEGSVQAPMTCKMPDPVSLTEKRRRLGESLVSEEAAEAACRHAAVEERESCKLDVMATNDLSMAGAY